MTSNFKRCVSGLAALVVVAMCVSSASACGTCGGGGATYGYAPSTYSAGYAPAYAAAYAPAYTTAYAPAYTTAYYAPQTYTANYGGSSWWGGCCLGRLFGWGSQPTYAAYAPAYAVSYASPCTSCASPCSSCAQVTMRPVCTTACAPSCGCSDCGSSCSSCSGCSSCGGGAVVTQAGYQVSSGCSSCGQAAPATTTVVVPGNQTVVVPGTQQMVVPGTQQMVVPGTQQMVVPNNTGSQSNAPGPELAPGEQVAPRTYQKPATENGEMQPVPAPANGTPPAEATQSGANATYFEAPKLFNPNDRTASRVAAPVHNAIYEKPASYRQVSTGPITAAQAQQDAAGWTSASN
jgi:hypothetical protein